MVEPFCSETLKLIQVYDIVTGTFDVSRGDCKSGYSGEVGVDPDKCQGHRRAAGTGMTYRGERVGNVN